MKILLVMETWDMTSGPWESLYPYFRRILTSWGHEVRAVDNKKNYLPVGGKTAWDYPPTSWRAVLDRLNSAVVNRMLRRVAEEYQPDLVLLTKCENISYSTIRWLKQNTNAVLFNWDHDNPFFPANTSMDLLRSMPHFDVFGVWARYLIQPCLSIECPRVEYLPMFFSPERFQSGSEITEAQRRTFGSDIVFVGLGTRVRVELLEYLTDFDLGLWGNWDVLEPDSPLRQHVRGRVLDGESYARVLQCSKIAVNVLNTSNRGASNTRTFEGTGVGTLLLTEYSAEQAEELFLDGEEIVCFRSGEELREKAAYYLVHDDERQAIARRGRERTLREHTLDARLMKILTLTEDCRARKR